MILFSFHFAFIFHSREGLERWIGILAFYGVICLSLPSFLLPWTILMLKNVNPFSWVLAYISRGQTRVSVAVDVYSNMT